MTSCALIAVADGVEAMATVTLVEQVVDRHLRNHMANVMRAF